MIENSPVAILRIAALIFVLVAPLVLNAYWLFLALQVVVYTYLALSFDLAYSYSRLLSFCQGLFFTISAYVATYVASSAGWGLPAMLLGGTLSAALLGAVVGLILMRMHTHAAIIATVIIAAASLLVGNALSTYTGGDDGLSLPTEHIGIGLWQMHSGLNLATYYLAAVPLVALICGLWRLRGTLTWTVIRAVAQNDVRARQLGYNVTLRRYTVFVASTAVAGLGGALYALVMNHVTTGLLDISVSVNAILYAVIGGLETDCGALVGALLVLPVTELIASVFTYVQIFVGLLLAVMAVAAPKGIVGTLLQRTSKSSAVQKTASDDGAPSDGLVRSPSI